MAKRPVPKVAGMGNLADGAESLSAIRVAHLNLMSRAAGRQEEGLAIEEVTNFLNRVRSAGRVIADEADRHSLQRMVDYWSGDLAERGVQTEKTSAEIAPLAPELAGGVVPGSPAEIKEANSDYIRISAIARQWKESGEDGYLLSGQALGDAEAFLEDEDIAELLDASLNREQVRSRRIIISLALTTLVLLGLSLFSVFLWRQAEDARAAELVLNRELMASLARQEELLKGLQNQSDDTRVRLSEQVAGSARTLALAIDTIIEQVRADKLSLSELGEDIRKETIASLTAKLNDKSIAPETLPSAVLTAVRADALKPLSHPEVVTLLGGYDPAFTGADIPLPSVAEARLATLFEGGEPVPYLHYSLVFDQARKMAVFSAANLDRQARTVLPVTGVGFLPDPRMPTTDQLDKLWPEQTDVMLGTLVARDHVSWGSYFSESDALSAYKLDQLIRTLTNAAPQFDSFNQDVWTGLQNWVLAEHNPLASRVTVLAGPVFDSDDDPVQNLPIPRSYWTIAVSEAQVASQASQAAPAIEQAAPGLVVDAFLVEQFVPGTDEVARTTFSATLQRVPVKDLEAVTGLDFGEAIRSADMVNPQTVNEFGTDGAMLVYRLLDLDAADEFQRKLAVQDIVFALRDDELTLREQRKVVEALVDVAQVERLLSMTLNGRYNVLFVLSQVPAAKWKLADWAPLREKATAAVIGLAQQEEIGPRTQALVAVLKDQLSVADEPLGNRPQVTVFFQFAGMTRGAAEALSGTLKQLGWAIPGEERTDQAQAQNEVRFNPDSLEDRRAAELLVEDLNAAGHPVSGGAVANNRIRPGTIEVWVSI